MRCLTLNVCVFVCVGVCAAVQEERQRGKERGENEVESTSSFNEEMPVDKILDAELAVEPKTETYSDGSPSNSVRMTASLIWPNQRSVNHSVFIMRLRLGEPLHAKNVLMLA